MILLDIFKIENYINQIFFIETMSTAYYNQKWESAISKILQNVDEENYPLEQNRNEKGINYKRNDYEWFQYYGALYLRYLQIYRQLEDAYDQMVHPQKRILMKDMLDNVIVRMCQVKQNIIRYSTFLSNPQTDYVNLDEILIQLKLTPKALALPLPKHFVDPTPRDQIVKAIQNDLGVSQEVEIVADTVTLDTNLQTVIRIIQKLQRGRQGIMRGLSFSKMRNKTKDRSPDAPNEQDRRTIVIQKYWRAFLARKELFKMRQEELRFLGIEKDPISKNLLEEAEKQRHHLKNVQKNRSQKFQEDREDLTLQIKKIQEPTIKHRMLDQRRKWIQKFLEMHQFSDVPKKSIDFYKQKDDQVIENDASKDKKDKGKGKQTKDGGKAKKNDVQKFLDEHLSVGPTETVLKMQSNIKKYTQTWGSRDQTEVSEEIYDSQLAKDQLRPGIQSELQKIVDSMINLQLDGMRIKYGIKKTKEKKARKKAKKVKKIKIPQALGKKNPRQLLQELYEKNIAKILASAHLNDMIGEHNTVTHLVQKNSQFLPDPSISQVRNIVAEYVGIPLGSEMAKEKLQKWSWFLFYGAVGTGKTLAIRALQKQTNAIVFDLTPESVKQRYTQKAELVKLIWSVIICAKEYQPAIIMIDDFDTIFSGVKGKKKDGTSSFGPKMKKIIADMKKNKLWTKTDRISIIACSNKPYDAALKECKKLFDKKIYFPFPNYATRKQIIRHFIQEKVGTRVDNFSYETLAHVSEGFTAGSFKQCIEKILSPLRIQRIKDEPLKLSQFISPLSNTICVFSGQYEKLRKFTDDVTGLKQKKEQKKQPEDDKGKSDKKLDKKKKA